MDQVESLSSGCTLDRTSSTSSTNTYRQENKPLRRRRAFLALY